MNNTKKLPMLTEDDISRFASMVAIDGFEDDPAAAMEKIASDTGVPIHQAVMELVSSRLGSSVLRDGTLPLHFLGYRDTRGDFGYWGDIQNAEIVMPEVDICDNSMLGEFVASVAASRKFPVQTLFLHALGIVSSAMTRQFCYEMYDDDENPVCMYTLTAQPPGASKSPCHKPLVEPIREAYSELNRVQRKKRSELEIDLASLADERKTEKNTEAKKEIAQKIAELQEKIKQTPVYKYHLDDATPEAMEAVAATQQGMVNVITDESDALNVALGNVYSDRTANNKVVLNMFDGGYHSSSRLSREGYEGRIYGAFCVLGQDRAMKALLTAGQNDSGISQRFLILAEKNNIGSRDYRQRIKIDPELRQTYWRTINNLVKAEPTILRFSDECVDLIDEYRNTVEPMMADGEIYSSNLLRGVVAKCDKQIAKIACVLHGIDNYQNSSSATTNIKPATVKRAIRIYDQLKDAYASAAGSGGFDEEENAISILVEKLKSLREKGAYTKVRDLARRVEKVPLFMEMDKPTQKIRDVFLPKLVTRGYIATAGGIIYMHPHLNKED